MSETLTIFERSRQGRRAFTPPPLDVPEVPISDLLPESAIRKEPAKLPEVSEPEIVRHYNRLSKKNFDLDSGFYPLGREYPEYENGLLVAITERRTKDDIDLLADTLESAVRRLATGDRRRVPA